MLSNIATVRRGTSKDGEVIGTTENSKLVGDIKFAVGDPSSSNAQWTEMKNQSRFTKTNNFTFSLWTPYDETRQLHWKGTHDVPKTCAQFDMVHLKLLNMAHLKLVDTLTGAIIARFLHKPGTAFVMEGTLEMHEELGADWDLKIFLSCLAVLKYMSLMWSGNVL